MMSALLMLTFIVTGCGKGGDYTNALPADAYMVASVDLKSVMAKSGLSSNETERLRTAVSDLLSSGVSAETLAQVEKVMQKPSESGIDFESPVYIFASPEVDGAAVLLRVADRKKLNNTIELLVKENIAQTLQAEEGCNYTVMNENLLIYSKSALVVAPYTGHSEYGDLKNALTKCLGQEAKYSMASGKAFAKMKARKDDIKFYASMMAIPDVYTQQLKLSVMNSDIDMKEIAAIGGLNFDKGRIDLQFSYYTENKEVEEMMKKQSKAMETIDRDYLSYFPQSTLVFASLGVNGKKLYEQLSANDELTDEMPVLGSDTGRDALSAFNGDVSVGITGMSMDGTPVFLAYAKVKNNDLLEALYAAKDFFLSSRESIEKSGKNEYVYTSASGQRTYFGMKKKNLYATNDKQLFDNICKDAKPSLKDAAYVKDIKGKTAFIAADVKAIADLPLLKMALGFAGPEAQMAYNLASGVDYVEMNSNADGVSNVSIVLVDKDSNALSQIVNIVGQVVNF
jgi:hypothetical protein